MQIIYGHQVAPEGDVFVTLADRALETLGHAGIFGTYLVDYIPLRAPLLPTPIRELSLNDMQFDISPHGSPARHSSVKLSNGGS